MEIYNLVIGCKLQPTKFCVKYSSHLLKEDFTMYME
jgi:hypothetical protein